MLKHIVFATPEKPSQVVATVKSYVDGDGDVTIEINGINVAFFCCDTGKLVLYKKHGVELEKLESLGIKFDEDGTLSVD
jgi:hypothetical protein